MLEYVIQEGDEVTGVYDLRPDGPRATVLGFTEIAKSRLGNGAKQPGIYRNRHQCRIQLEDGTERAEFVCELKLTDSDEYMRRVAAWEEAGGLSGYDESQDFIRDLPDTPFWEGDLVRFVDQTKIVIFTEQGIPRDIEVFTIIDIEYERLEHTRDDGSPWPAYGISDKLGSSCWVKEAAHELELVERGLVWKYFHDEAIDFDDLEEEANFFWMLGHFDEVRNPFAWTLKEALDAIERGAAHSICQDLRLDQATCLRAIKYHDEDLGRRVAAATLQAFGRRD